METDLIGTHLRRVALGCVLNNSIGVEHGGLLDVSLVVVKCLKAGERSGL